MLESHCKAIIELEKMKLKLFEISYNPVFIMEKDGEVLDAKPLHDMGMLPNGESLASRLEEIDRHIRSYVEEMGSLIKVK